MWYMLLGTQKQIYQKADVLFSETASRYFDGGGQVYTDQVSTKGNIKEISKLKITTVQEIPGNGSNTRSVAYPLGDFLGSSGAAHKAYRNDNGEEYCTLYVKIEIVNDTAIKIQRRCVVANGRHVNFYSIKIEVEE